MCGIVGFLDKTGGSKQPIGKTVLAMLQALSCRGPDSAGVALFGAPQPGWKIQIKLPEQREPTAAAAEAGKGPGGKVKGGRREGVGACLRGETTKSLGPQRFAGGGLPR